MREFPLEKQIILREVLHCVDSTLKKKCTSRERAAFVKKYLDGLSSNVVAEQMHSSVVP